MFDRMLQHSAALTWAKINSFGKICCSFGQMDKGKKIMSAPRVIFY